MRPTAIEAADLMHATLVRRPFNRAGWVFENDPARRRCT